jgi:8-oxo-dGTP pyrophosphatase MutT (NUDIX family)
LTKLPAWGLLGLMDYRNSFLGVEIANDCIPSLRGKFENLSKGAKETLFLLESESLLRANRNPAYKFLLNQSRLKVVTDEKVLWSVDRKINPGFLAELYSNRLVNLTFLLRVPIFLILFFFSFIRNIILFLISKLNPKPIEDKHQYFYVSEEDLLQFLLQESQKHDWKVLILANRLKKTEVRENIRQNYPELIVDTWSPRGAVCFLEDEPSRHPEVFGKHYPDSHTWLTRENLYEVYPDLIEAKEYIKAKQPDLILVDFPGSSGKEDFFVDNLSLDKELNFTLAVSFDDLSGLIQSKIEPDPRYSFWRVSFREKIREAISFTYNQIRKIDASWGLIWWTTLQEFMLGLEKRPRETVISIIQNEKDEFLLVRRRNWLAGDIGWTFVQGKIEGTESIEETAIREAEEEVDLEAELFKPLHKNSVKIPGVSEPHSFSFKRFILHGCNYNCSQHHPVLLKYTGDKKPKPNWENAEAKWVGSEMVEKTLSIEKRNDWIQARKALEKINKYPESKCTIH